MSIVLDAADAGAHGVSVSTTLVIDLCEPGWQRSLVEGVSAQAVQGALRLRDELLVEEPEARHGFIPLAALLADSRDGAPRTGRS